MNITTLRYDLLLIRKDPMLMLSAVVPLLLWAVMHFGFPVVQQLALTHTGTDISPWREPAGLFLLAVIPMMFGMVYGFMLLDERDAGIITAIGVTPMGRNGYLALRMGMPMAFSFVTALAFCLLLDIGSQRSLPSLMVLVAMLTLNAPILLLFLGAFAANKVEGMAMAKGYGILLSAMLVDFIVPHPWNYLGAFSPLFWFARAMPATQTIPLVFYMAMTLITHLLLLYLLHRKFLKKMN